MKRNDLIYCLAVFVASRALYAALGLQFDASTFPGYFQFLDPVLLSNRLLESLWYYHANPPLMNLFVGLSRQWFGGGAVLFSALCLHLLGLVLAIAVMALTLRLAGSRLAARIAVTLLVFSPAFVLYENWLMYSFPTTALVTISAWVLLRFYDTGRPAWASLFFSLLAVITLTRSLFHLAWMALVAALLMVFAPAQRRTLVRAAAVPLLVVVLWYGKNAWLFGNFGASSWMGLGMSNITTLVVPRDQLEPLVRSGELTPYALISRYQQIQELFAHPPAAPSGIEALDQILKSSGQYNFNNAQMLEINRAYTHDAFVVIKHFPGAYLTGLSISNRLFFSPTSMNLYFTADNRAAVLPMERIFNPLLYGARSMPGSVEQPHYGFNGTYMLEVNASIALMLLWAALGVYGLVRLRSGLRSNSATSRAESLVIGYIVYCTLYVWIMGTAFDLAENFRYRFLVEPLMLVLTVAAFTDLARAARKARAADGGLKAS